MPTNPHYESKKFHPIDDAYTIALHSVEALHTPEACKICLEKKRRESNPLAKAL